jgi:putative ABC transport system ATP-binding protein
MAGIELVELTKTYRQGRTLVRALDGVSLRIEPGEFVSVVGRSGSGKTTLLDLVGLLLRPTAGRLLMDGVDVARLKDDERADMRGQRIGVIFQEYNLLPTLNVLDNVLLPLRYTRSRVGDRLRHRPDELSGGQQQRVAIARALVNRPAVVLGDEPTGAVDTQTSQELLDLMRWLNHEEGVTFVIVTHDPDLAARTDRTIRLSDGRVVSDEVVRSAA